MLGAAALLGLTGCGEKQIDTAKLERKIADDSKKTRVPIKTIDCPGDVNIKAKDTFDCKATTNNGSVTVRVTQTDDKANVTYEYLRRR